MYDPVTIIPFAWYTDTTGLNYNDLCYEYLYLLVATMTGDIGLASRTITSLWDPYTSVPLLTMILVWPVNNATTKLPYSKHLQ